MPTSGNRSDCSVGWVYREPHRFDRVCIGALQGSSEGLRRFTGYVDRSWRFYHQVPTPQESLQREPEILHRDPP